MHRVSFRRWTVEVDVDATSAVYAAIAASPPSTGCDCSTCRNYRALGLAAFPKELVDFASATGLDLLQPTESYDNGELPDGSLLYAGWYHVVGRILEGRSGWKHVTDTSADADFEALTSSFRVGLSNGRDLLPAPFAGLETFQLDFDAALPWVLPEPPPGAV